MTHLGEKEESRTMKNRGFSLVELLTVMAVVVLMMALMLPSISAFSGSAGRRGAVNSLMNAFEQARASALETGCNVYVVMRRNQTVGGGNDTFLVARLRSDTMGDPQAPEYITLTPWKKMPNGVVFHQAPGSVISSGSGLPTSLINSLPGNVPAGELYGIGYNRTGQIFFSTGNRLSLYLAEAVQGSGPTATLKTASTTITERLSFRKYTGRTQLDFTAP